MKSLLAFMLGFTLMMTLLVSQAIISKAWSTDLPVPKRSIEHCAENNKSFVGQVLQADKTCKSGMRWKNQ
jgi:hypothetical protein